MSRTKRSKVELKTQADADAAFRAAEDAFLAAQIGQSSEPARVIAPGSGPITTTDAINAENTRFWSTPEAQRDQRAIATQIAVTVKGFKDRDKKKTKSASVAKLAYGNKVRKLVLEELGKLKRPGGRENAARIIAPRVRDRLRSSDGDPVSSPSADRVSKILQELGLPKPIK
jgi:hypothetical protein